MTPTDADREAAWAVRPFFYREDCRERWMAGVYDKVPGSRIQAFARHRTASTAALMGEVERLREALEWFSGQRRLSLEHYSPMYGDDDDQSIEWRVHRESGSINDREWEIVGRGETALAAIQSARTALSTPSEVSEPVADEAELAAFGASEAAAIYYPGEDQQAERLAFCAGAAHAVLSPVADESGGEGEKAYRVRRLHDGVKAGFAAVVDDPTGWPICHCMNGETAGRIALCMNLATNGDAVREALAQAAADFDEHASFAQSELEAGDEDGSTVWRNALAAIKAEASANAQRVRATLAKHGGADHG